MKDNELYDNIINNEMPCYGYDFLRLKTYLKQNSVCKEKYWGIKFNKDIICS